MLENEQSIKYIKLFRFATRIELMLNILGLLLAVVAGVTLPMTTILFGDLIDDFGKWTAQPFEGALITADQLVNSVSEKSLYFVYLAVISYVTTYVFTAAFVYSAERSSHRIRNRYLQSVLRQNISWFDNVGAGEIATRISSDTLLIQDGIGEKLPIAISLLFTFIGGFVIAFYRGWQLTLVLMSVIPFIAISAAFMHTLASRFQTRIQALYSTSGNIAEESFSAIRTVSSFNGQKKVSELYNRNLKGAREEGLKKSIASGIGIGAVLFFIYCAYSLAFWYGGILLQNGKISPGIVVNVFFAVLIGAVSLGQIAPSMEAISIATASGAKIFQTIDRIPEIDSSSTKGAILDRSTLKGKIDFRDITFTYPSRPDIPILQGFSMTAMPGSTVALVGESGSGKSTIVSLLERFYNPSGGVIELDGVPLQDINLTSLRQQIGLVQQEPVLFEGTVGANVAMGLAATADEFLEGDLLQKKIEDACRQANAHDFIMELPQKYDTPVGERGMLLSGGQKQRIAIARAIIKNPTILLLDEATSALDTTSEVIVQKALDNVSKSRTTITIAHRLSTIKKADNIIVMVKGEIVEQGDHATLVNNKGLYSRLVAAQDIESEAPGEAQETKKNEEKDQKGLNKSSVRNSFGKNNNDPEFGKNRSYTSWQVLRSIMKLNSDELKYTIPGLFAAIGSGLVNPFFALVFAEIIATFSKKGPELEADTHKWALIFVGLAFYAFLTGFFQQALFGYAAELLTERLRKLVFSSILNQDIAFFDADDHTTGELTSSLATDAQKVQGASGATLGTMLQMLSNLIGAIVISLIYGWKLALVATAVLPLLVFTGAMRLKIVTYFAEKCKVAYSKSAQMACEATSAIRTVQSLCRENAVHRNYIKMLEGPKKAGKKNAIFNTHLYAAAQSFNYLINGLVFWYGGKLLAYEGYDVRDFFTVFVAIIFGAQGIGRIFALVPDLGAAKDAGINILNLLNRKPLINVGESCGQSAEKIDGDITFVDVVFSYPTRPHITVLNNLSLEVKPGQFVAFVGPSGCGKSTTIGLLERFYDISAGRLLIDGQPLASYNLQSYRNIVGLVSQEPNLFNMTIRENIMFGCDSSKTEDDMITAAKEANIHTFITSLPEGYSTMVGQKGSQLSGGQKQRIAIARALVKKPRILLLDEATSALDAESEKVVQEALDKAVRGRTTIAIAHRLSTIRTADLICVFDHGKIIERGTHDELFAAKGAYYELARKQDLRN